MKRPHLRRMGVHPISPACGCYRCCPGPCDGERFSNLLPQRSQEEFLRDAREALALMGRALEEQYK